MKKVAIFISNLMGGGAERIVSYLLNEGCDKFEMHLVMFKDDVAYEIPRDKIKVFILEGAGTGRLSPIIRMRSLSKKLKEYLEENKIDTVLSLLNRCNLIACRAKKNGWKGKLVISERADTMAHYDKVRFGWYMIWLVKKYYPYANEVTVISKGIAGSLSKLGIKNSRVIYNPVYAEAGLPVQTERPFTFINVARLEPQKNQTLLINAFAMLKNQNCKLNILGIGWMDETLQKLVHELKLNDRIHFQGFQKDVTWWLLRSDCFVFSSDYEGLGNVLIEALNAGLPVISTDCPSGPGEILDPSKKEYIKEGIHYGEYGILTPVGNVKMLANAMDEMMVRDDLRKKYNEKAKKRSHDFNLEETTKKYFDLF